MLASKLLTLFVIFFLTTLVSVGTGSTSLIAVPTMIAFGMEPHIAIATNMLALTFMSAGGSLPFIRGSAIRRDYLPGSIVLTVVGSGLSALLLLTVPLRALKLTIAVAMIAVAIFTLVNRDLGLSTGEKPVARASVDFEPWLSGRSTSGNSLDRAAKRPKQFVAILWPEKP